jgi:predicted lipoprotein with Yx(FWY)xxD motif
MKILGRRIMWVFVTLIGMTNLAGADPLVSAKVLSVVATDGRLVLASGEMDLTLYTFDSDSDGVSNCYNSCERAWPVVRPVDGVSVATPLSIIDRRDGTKQLAIKGRPLYFYVGDEKVGDMNGDGLGGVWHVANASLLGQ